ncbi:sulfotransferase 1C2A-like isoform X2 [Tubulanus polymorphus]|uniref:sulfotransferase 1C2A-like isoform X2 n=1 Tax=Tubulanus polymorphus TaxID=672921 RepID=UPI003DA67E56
MSTNCTGTADDEQFSTLHQIPDQFEIVEHGFIGGYFTPPEILDKVRNYEVFEDDCFVASYPKTAEKMPRPRLMKSHLPFDMFPIQAMGEKAKIIYVMRNPKDTLVSYYHFYKSCKSFGNFPGSWDDFFQLFLHKKLFCGDFYDHVLSWWNQRHRDNILFLKYEDMVTDPKSNILKICAFLGKTLSDDEIDNIVKQTSFEIMRDNPTTNFSQTHYQDNKICPFIRKGKIGDWKNFFTDEQCRIIDKIHEDRLAETGLSFQFE